MELRVRWSANIRQQHQRAIQPGGRMCKVPYWMLVTGWRPSSTAAPMQPTTLHAKHVQG